LFTRAANAKGGTGAPSLPPTNVSKQTGSVIMPSSLSPSLLELIYDAASIRRWNDQINPMDFTELDKQAHKMIIAYVLAKFEEEQAPDSISWLRLLEGGIFEMFHRIVLTDIKPPVFHKMMAEKGRELNHWVLQHLKEQTAPIPGGFRDRMKKHFLDPNYASREKRVLKAAHYLATQWEFNILYKMCPFIKGIEQIRQEIEDQIEDHYDLLGVQKISLGRKTAGFVDLCGQLRFQKRWSQSPRIPATSVLGHMLVVALLTYLALCEVAACEQRLINGFLAALFHDLPEVLTRDITSPIKGAVVGLDDIIKEYEERQMEDRLLPLLPSAWHDEIRYYTLDEFSNRIKNGHDVRSNLSFAKLEREYNDGHGMPVDGEIIRCCDHLAAFIEVSLSIRHGVSSKHLLDGAERLYEMYKQREVGTLNFGEVFRHFVPRKNNV
jgi:putative hydrolase of HD superfamily